MNVMEKIEELKIVPVVVLHDAKDAVPLAQALTDGGLPVAEVTFRTEAAEESIRQMSREYPDMLVGAGTVLTTEQVDRAAAADRVAKKFILQNNAGQQMAEFDGSADRTVQLTPGQVGAEPAFTKNNAFNKNFGSAAGTVCQGNDGRLSNARRASNISMSLSGTTLTINYS